MKKNPVYRSKSPRVGSSDYEVFPGAGSRMNGGQLLIVLSPMTCSCNGEKVDGLVLMVEPALYMPGIETCEGISAHRHQGSPDQCRVPGSRFTG